MKLPVGQTLSKQPSLRGGGTSRGVSIPFPKRYADSMRLEPGEGFEAFRFDGEGWCMPLQGSGIPVVINGDGYVTAITGQSLRALQRSEIEALLHRGLLLDGSAAAVLCELGFQPLIGVVPGKRVERLDTLLSAERDDWAEEATELDPVYMSLRTLYGTDMRRFYPLTLMSGALSTSFFVDPDHRDVMPGMVVFENEWGGRVAVYPFDFSMDALPLNWRRRRQLQRIVRWLGSGRVDLFVDGGTWMMPVRRDYQEYSLLAVLNFGLDSWNEINLTFTHDMAPEDLRFEHLNNDGAFREITPAALKRDGHNVLARLALSLPALDCAALRVSHF